MGFYSWKCALTQKSIPAYPYADRPVEDSTVRLILPDDSHVVGVYDGYGNINGQDVLETLAPFFFNDPDATRDDVFNEKKYLTSPVGKEFTIQQFMWNEPLADFDGNSLNQLRHAGWKIDEDFYRIKPMIKIVRDDAYNGETYDELPASEDCPCQGFFYGRDTE